MAEICKFCKTTFELKEYGFTMDEITYCSAPCLHKERGRNENNYG